MQTLKNITTVLLAVLITGFFLSPLLGSIAGNGTVEFANIALAQSDEPYRFLAPIGGLGEDIDVSSEDSFPEYIQTMITIVIGFAIMAAIILIIASGFQYMTSTSQSGVSKAKEQITNAILGLVLALSAVVILQTINPELIELNSVRNVTTSGDSLVVDESGPESTEHGGEVLPDDGSNQHGDMWCMNLDGEWNLSWFFNPEDNRNYDRFVCYDNVDDCNSGMNEAEALGQETAEWFGALECKYYYESTGELINLDTEQIEADLIGVGTDSQSAVESCEASAQDIVTTEPKIDACIQYAGTEMIDPEKCVAVCGDVDEMDFDEPLHWMDHVWSPVDDPTNSIQKNSRNLCNVQYEQGCYPHPDGIDGNETICSNCVWLDGGSYNVRELESVCSPNNSDVDPDYCRIKAELSGRLSELDIQLDGAGVGYRIIESFPPKGPDNDECYYDGSCVSIQLMKDSYNQGDTSYFSDDDHNEGDPEQKHVDAVGFFVGLASANGLDVQYRVGNNDLRDYLIDELGWDDDNYIHGLTSWSTPHFKVELD